MTKFVYVQCQPRWCKHVGLTDDSSRCYNVQAKLFNYKAVSNAVTHNSSVNTGKHLLSLSPIHCRHLTTLVILGGNGLLIGGGGGIIIFYYQVYNGEGGRQCV